MVHVDVKKVGRIPDGGGHRVHDRGSAQAKAADRARAKGARGGYVYLHSAVDGHTRLAYTESLPDEKATTAIGFVTPAKAFFAAHGITWIRIVTDNGLLLPGPRLRPRPPGRTAPADHPLHATAQRQGRALQPDPGRRGIPLRPRMDLRTPAGRGAFGLERPLQLPSTAYCRRKPATGRQGPRPPPTLPTSWPHTSRSGRRRPPRRPRLRCCPSPAPGRLGARRWRPRAGREGW